jgi:O-antigen/teichoic acid export membrane protein
VNLVRSLRISQLQVNLAANFAGRIWGALIGIVFVPIYVRYLGIESYGLVGFFVALQATAQVLDFGLAATLNRELARLSALPDRRGEARDFVRTLEVGYWSVGGFLALGTWALAPLLAAQWIQAGSLPLVTVENAVRAMAVVLGLQWPLGIYYGGLMGLQRQASANALRIGMTTLAAVGAAVMLARISPDIGTFFLWQGIAAAGHLALAVTLLWRTLPASDHRPRFSWSMLRGSWKFAAGMTGITITAVIATQLDKVLLSGLLSLEMFGYYSLASVLAGGLRIVSAPMFDALFPRFSSLIALGDEPSLQTLYHRSAQLMSTLMIPLTAVLSLFAYEAVSVWTGSLSTGARTAPALALLALGNGINGLWMMPYTLQLAAGWTGLALGLNTFLIAGLIPALVVLAPRYGAVGAAGAWAGLNAIGLLAASWLTHRRILRRQWSLWAKQDIALPLVGGVVSTLAIRQLVPFTSVPGPQAAVAGLALVAATGASALLAPELRSWAVAQFYRMWPVRP